LESSNVFRKVLLQRQAYEGYAKRREEFLNGQKEAERCHANNAKEVEDA